MHACSYNQLVQSASACMTHSNMTSTVNSGTTEGDVWLNVFGKTNVPGCAMDSRIIWCSTDSLTLKNVSRPGFP